MFNPMVLHARQTDNMESRFSLSRYEKMMSNKSHEKSFRDKQVLLLSRKRSLLTDAKSDYTLPILHDELEKVKKKSSILEISRMGRSSGHNGQLLFPMHADERAAECICEVEKSFF